MPTVPDDDDDDDAFMYSAMDISWIAKVNDRGEKAVYHCRKYYLLNYYDILLYYNLLEMREMKHFISYFIHLLLFMCDTFENSGFQVFQVNVVYFKN